MNTFIIVLLMTLNFVSIGLGLWMNNYWHKICNSMNEDWYDTCKKLEEENTKLKKELKECKK